MTGLDINYNVLETPSIEPWMVRATLQGLRGKQVSKRMLSHYVRTTIGQTSSPAQGRGTVQLSSPKDVALILSGMDLAELGLGPTQVKKCVSVLKRAWPKLVLRILARVGRT